MIFDDWWGWIEETIDPSALHEVLSDQPGEGKKAFDAGLQDMCHAQEQERNQGDSNLSSHGVLGSAEEVADF